MTEKKETHVIGQEAVQYQNLRLGSEGKDVEKLQTALGFTGEDVDGIYGQKTQQAVMDYQRNNNLTVDGIAGQQTQTALYRNAGASSDATVNQAQQILAKNLGNQSYTPVWEEAAQQYLQQYQNREPFSYDFATDALWQQYADQYANSAKLAMMDTMGQAAAMTGGYGSTWAQAVGQQAYNQQMSQLNNIIPELESRAYDRYQQEGNDLLTQYSLYRDLENQEYAKWRDAVSDYQWQQSFDESKRQANASLYDPVPAPAPTIEGFTDPESAYESFDEEVYKQNVEANGKSYYKDFLDDAKAMLLSGESQQRIMNMLYDAVGNSLLSPTEFNLIRNWVNHNK